MPDEEIDKINGVGPEFSPDIVFHFFRFSDDTVDTRLRRPDSYCPDEEIVLLSLLKEEVLVVEKVFRSNYHLRVVNLALVEAHTPALDEAAELAL
jgi:hypothetical protein